jgi:hypothetical protein
LTITPVADGDPTINLDWAHDGVDLDRFEVLYRLVGGTTWTSLLLAPKADFGAGPYSLTTASRPNVQWAVRAVAADGSVST